MIWNVVFRVYLLISGKNIWLAFCKNPICNHEINNNMSNVMEMFWLKAIVEIQNVETTDSFYNEYKRELIRTTESFFTMFCKRYSDLANSYE